MLILWDIDATLITTSRAGIAAMGRAGRELFGDSFDENTVEYAGRLDPLIIGDLLVAHGRTPSREAIELFREGYGRHLGALLEETKAAKPCAGVRELLAALRADGRAAMGLLTGNFPETGAIKLRAAGIEPDEFQVRVWGCDSPHDPPSRDHLPEVAMARHAGQKGGPISPTEVVVIGDTPHDVRCARAHGCRSLGVATGSYRVEDLERAGADLALTDLTDTERALRWLLNETEAPRSGHRGPSARSASPSA